MKKIFNTLLITLVTLISVFAFSIVYADGGGHTFTVAAGSCVYENNGRTITINVYDDGTTDIEVNTGGARVLSKNIKKEYDDSRFLKSNGEPNCHLIYVKVEPGKQAKYYIDINNREYEKSTFLYRKGPHDCTFWSDYWDDVKKESYNKTISEIKAEFDMIDKEVKNPYSYIQNKITHNSERDEAVNTYGVRYVNDSVTCSELKEYRDYTFNTLNPTYADSNSHEQYTRIERMQDKISNLYTNFNGLNICDNGLENYKTYINELNSYESRIALFAKALVSAADQDASLFQKNNCEEDPYAFKNWAESQIEYIERKQRQDMLVGATFKFKSGCAIIGGDFKDFLNTVLFYIRLVAIILAVVLSLLDYIKAASASDDKPMSAANKRFITRLILVIVLFLLPVLLTFILNVLNINSVTGDSIECLDIDK